MVSWPTKSCSFSRLLLSFSLSVGKSDIQFLGSLDNSESLSDRDTLANFSAVCSVVHEEEFDVFLVSDQQFFESVWQSVSGEVVLLATNLWHFLGTLHSSSGEAINTTDLSVGVWINSLELMRLESIRCMGDFLHNFSPA